MVNRFLRAKHWQLFLLTFGIPLIFQVIMMGIVFTSIGREGSPAPQFMFSYFRLFPVMMIIFMAVYFGWFWAVAIGLQQHVPESVHMKVKKFKVLFLIPMLYMLLLALFIGGFMQFVVSSEGPSGGFIGGIAAIIVPLHLLSMFCIFYTLYFVAKTIKTVELQREVNFSDFAGEFFMIWFYPIGVWILQPKINAIVR
ncbi:hypothetical protein [uncultured Pontibacter sp.]|uniref:hypothetical protein n=1 Tax=uncultured Pontibacter sp. TaxID=453356 RepID=UPI00261268EE|nr:hypothetical protein [uncultured Pontibacter sp.]